MQGAQAASCPPLVITTCRPLPPLGLTRLSRALLPPRSHHAGAAPLCSRHGPPEAVVATSPGVLHHTQASTVSTWCHIQLERHHTWTVMSSILHTSTLHTPRSLLQYLILSPFCPFFQLSSSPRPSSLAPWLTTRKPWVTLVAERSSSDSTSTPGPSQQQQQQDSLRLHTAKPLLSTRLSHVYIAARRHSEGQAWALTAAVWQGRPSPDWKRFRGLSRPSWRSISATPAGASEARGWAAAAAAWAVCTALLMVLWARRHLQGLRRCTMSNNVRLCHHKAR